MRSALTLSTFLVVVVVAAASVLLAGDRLHGRSGGDMDQDAVARVFERIGVSDDQRGELEAAHLRHDEIADGLHALMDAAHERLARAIHAEVFDETAIRNAAADYAVPQADLFVAKAEMLQEARRILTPDQLQEMLDLHRVGDDGHSMRQGHGGPHGHGHHGE